MERTCVHDFRCNYFINDRLIIICVHADHTLFRMCLTKSTFPYKLRYDNALVSLLRFRLIKQWHQYGGISINLWTSMAKPKQNTSCQRSPHGSDIKSSSAQLLSESLSS